MCNFGFFYRLSISPNGGEAGTTFTVTYSGKDRDKIDRFRWGYESDGGNTKGYSSSFTAPYSGTIRVYAEVSKSGYDGFYSDRVSVWEKVDTTTHTVTIGTLTNANGCTITATPNSGRKGKSITLTIFEVIGYRLKPNTLKCSYIDLYGVTQNIRISESSKSFELSDYDVTITAEFESDGTIESGEAFIGKWRGPSYYAELEGQGSGPRTVLLINRDKTFSFTYYGNVYQGTYSTDGNRIKFQFNSDDWFTIPLVENNLNFPQGTYVGDQRLESGRYVKIE